MVGLSYTCFVQIAHSFSPGMQMCCHGPTSKYPRWHLRPEIVKPSVRNNFRNSSGHTYSVSQKNPPPPRGPDISHFPHKRLRIFNRFFTHLLHVPIYARLQIFIQLSPTLTKLCHIKRDYAVHIICAKCPKRAKTRAFRRLRKWLIALLIVVCGK